MLVESLKNLDKTNVDIAGGKGASLGEMIKSGFFVPDGFVVLTSAFEKFLNDNNLNERINTMFLNIDGNNATEIEKVSNDIKKLIVDSKISKDIETEVMRKFDSLISESDIDNFYVAVRSSATVEDGVDNAWAGQLDSFLNISRDDLLEAIKKGWMSLFTPRAIFYRFEKKINKKDVSVAVVVQKMVNSEKSGVAFSINPISNDKDQILIEAGFGLGEAVVSGEITPDSYIVDKNNKKILNIKINKKSKALYNKKNGSTEWVTLDTQSKKQVLNKNEILKLVDIVKDLEKHYDMPVDVEWAIEDALIYITQSRPITTFAKTEEKHNDIFLYDLDDYKLLFDIEEAPPFFIESVLYAGYMDKEEIATYTKKDGAKFYYSLNNLTKYAREGEELFLDDKKIEKFFLNCNDIAKKINEFVKSVDNKLIDTLDLFELKKILKKYRDLEEEFYALYKFTEFVYFNSLEEKIKKQLKNEFGEKYKKGYLFEAIHGDLKLNDEKITKLSNIIRRLSEEKLNMRNLIGLMVDVEIKILGKIAVKNNLTLEKLECLYLNEIFSLCDGKLKLDKAEKLIDDREKGLVFISDKKGGFKEYLNNDALKIIEMLRKNKNNVKNKVLFGQPVNMGKVKGRALIVPYVVGSDSKFLENINREFVEGDVIVARNTTPELIPIIKKASAVVTKEGGITCHAAIIAREFSIPGIVGVEGLFANIKTGDLLEVDANNGKIKIIKEQK